MRGVRQVSNCVHWSGSEREFLRKEVTQALLRAVGTVEAEREQLEINHMKGKMSLDMYFKEREWNMVNRTGIGVVGCYEWKSSWIRKIGI